MPLLSEYWMIRELENGWFKLEVQSGRVTKTITVCTTIEACKQKALADWGVRDRWVETGKMLVQRRDVFVGRKS